MNYDARDFDYQTDALDCEEWFDRGNNNEPTRRTKEWLSKNGYPQTKTALCSAKPPKFIHNEQYKYMYGLS